MNRLGFLFFATLAACGAAPAAPAPPTPPTRAQLEGRARSLLGLTSDRAPSFTHDGTRVLFTSDRGGLPQLYVAELAQPERPPRRLMSWPDPVRGAVVTWDDRAAVFASDRGGDEQTHFFKVELATGRVEPLTEGPLNRDAPLLPELAPDRFFFSARPLNEVATGIYRQSLERRGGERLVYKDARSGFLVDVNRDGRFGLFVRFLTHQSQELVNVDLTTGAARTLYPPSGPATVGQAAFSPDGRRLYVSTDAGGEGAIVLALDAESGAELARYREAEPATAAPESVWVARQGGRVAVTFDAGDHSLVRLLDAETLTPAAKVQLPRGVGEPGGFSDDGERFALCWATIERPCSLSAISTRTGEAAALTREARPELEALPAVRASSEAVVSFDGLRIPTDIFRPAGPARAPVIVFLHGGPAGSAKAGWSATARFFLSEGYAWVQPNIRGSGGFGRAFEAADDGPKRRDSFRDIEAVRAWVAAQPWADAERLVVMGGSFGGFLVLSELTRAPGRWRAGVDEFGIADFMRFMATTKGLVRENYLHELGDPARDGALLRELSPINAVAQIRTPLFVYTGANDPRVPKEQSDLIVRALRERGVPVDYMVGLNEGHGVERRENQIELFARVSTFLRAQLFQLSPRLSLLAGPVRAKLEQHLCPLKQRKQVAGLYQGAAQGDGPVWRRRQEVQKPAEPEPEENNPHQDPFGGQKVAGD